MDVELSTAASGWVGDDYPGRTGGGSRMACLRSWIQILAVSYGDIIWFKTPNWMPAIVAHVRRT